MTWYIDLWLFLFLVNAIVMIYKLFNFSSQKITFGVLFKLLVLQYIALLLVVFYYTIFRQGLNEKNIHLLHILIPSVYGVYVVCMFRYYFNEIHFIWFNGICLRKIPIKSIDQIRLWKKRDKVVKITIYSGTKEINLHNATLILPIILRMAHVHHIKVNNL